MRKKASRFKRHELRKCVSLFMSSSKYDHVKSPSQTKTRCGAQGDTRWAMSGAVVRTIIMNEALQRSGSIIGEVVPLRGEVVSLESQRNNFPIIPTND